MRKKIILTLVLFVFFTVFAAAQNIDIVGPPGSQVFGRNVYALPGGNIVVTDPGFDLPGIADAGAVYLYDGQTGGLISTLTGSAPNDLVGQPGVRVLANGNFVVESLSWHNGAVVNAGAITFCSGTTGCAGPVSAGNSLIGSTANDSIAMSATPLTNGNYVVKVPAWNNGATADVGAVAWCDGTTGCTGPVSAAASLIGTTAADFIGIDGVTALPNGNYLVRSPSWNLGGATDAGAITLGNGTTGTVGTVSAANSLVGSAFLDQIGSNGIIVLPNGNYLVRSNLWDNGAVVNAGAVTFGSGTTGVSGPISAANSLVGTNTDDAVGSGNLVILTNGNYVVGSSAWRNGGATRAGAATFCDGAAGCTGAISAANSLVGTTTDDFVGSGITALANGNYVVRSSSWTRGAIVNAGAATFGSGTSGVTGPVDPSNSLVGSTNEDQVGSTAAIALTNGGYVVLSPNWDNFGITDAGAATWCSGTAVCPGTLSPGNSLVGSSAGDRIGFGGGIGLTNGNYAVISERWNNGPATMAGAVTFGSGTSGVAGPVSAANSLVGTTVDDLVGNGGVTRLPNGNYVIGSRSWDNGAVTNAGAVTFANGTTGISGAITAANSLIGSTANDFVGSSGVFVLTTGNYVVTSPDWDNGALANAGAATFGSGTSGISGFLSPVNSLVGSSIGDQVGAVSPLPNGNYAVLTTTWDNGALVNAGAVTKGSGLFGAKGIIDSANSVRGTATGGGTGMGFVFDAVNNQLVVARPAENIVTLARPFGPTAANVTVSGRVFGGRSTLARANVTMTDAAGSRRTVKTNSFGYFRFENVRSGEAYIFSADAKGYRFAAQIVTVNEDLVDFDFNAL
jgi:hypothetical protein